MGTDRWERLPRAETADPVLALRAAIAGVRAAPQDPEARSRVRAIAEDPELREPLAVLLADEARAAKGGVVAAALFEELAELYENLEQPLDAIAAMEAVVAHHPGSVDHHDRLAWLYRRAGAHVKAAAEFERVGQLATDDRGRAALHAAGRLYREHGLHDRAAETYRAIVDRRASDQQAWRELDDVLSALGRWSELADLRAERAALARSGVDRAALLRSQARALEQAGQLADAARVVGESTVHAPDDLSGLVNHADVLARGGRSDEAAGLLRARIAEALERGADHEQVAALRLRLVGIIDDAGDRMTATANLRELLAAAPEHLPALERAAAFAATDPDPGAHATALLRYAAALPRVNPAIVAAAARQFRAAGDHEAAVRALEDAVHHDARLERDLEDARTALIVERARAAAQAGDLGGAERKLRAIVAQQFSQDAHLALVDVLTAAGRFDAAAAHLRDTLAELDTHSGGPVAALVHRQALVEQALDHDDEAHRLLHEAHRLDRRDLTITLALGESCYQRRLWREAARHLGSLGDHPDARRHAAAVATGLVHAAAAEARSRRPANALAHLEAAVQIDGRCAAAWHGLAENAIERGDLERAADYLEREATATVEPRERVRLFDALGDMAHDVLGDPPRAERCWSQVIDLADVTVLGKLLAVQRKRGATRERARTCLRLAELGAERKPMLEEGAEMLVAAGECDRALEIARQLIASHPLDIDSVTCATDVAIAAGDRRHAAVWLRRALAAQPPGNDARVASLWRKLGDAERSLDDLAAARRAYRQATVVAPDSDGALAARRALVDLALLPTAGDQPATSPFALQSSLFALVESEPAPSDALALARELVDRDPDHARAAFELARALGGTLTAADERFFERHPPRAMASDEVYASRLDAATRHDLIDDAADAPLGELLEILGEVASRICPDARTALLEAGLDGAQRVPATGDSAAAAILPQIAKAFEGPPTLLYTSARAPRDLTVLACAPAVIVIGPRLYGSTNEAELRFELGRAVELSRARRLLATGSDDFAAFVAALAALGTRDSPQATREATRAAERLRANLPVTHRRRLADRLAELSVDALDAAGYLAACRRAADRAGLLACGDAGVAIGLAGGPDAAPHLVQLAATRSYLAARRRLRVRELDDVTSPFSR